MKRPPILLFAFALGLACSDDDSTSSDEGASTPNPDDSGADESGEEGNGEEEGGEEGNGEEGGAVDNVAACEDLLDALECGEVDLTQTVSCDMYANTTCDLVDYFTCLEDNFTCTDGVFDPTGWTMCAELATCS